MILLSGIFITIATYLISSKNLIQIIIGLSILTHAGHLLLMTMGGLKKGSVPLLGEGAAVYVDPLPHALILTSIVINFGVNAFLLVLTYLKYEEIATDNLFELRGRKHE